MSFLGGIWNGIKSVGKTIGGVAKSVAPVLGVIPGVGTLAAGAIGGLGGLLHGGPKEALTGALGGVSGGLAKKALGAIPGLNAGAASTAVTGGAPAANASSGLFGTGISAGDLVKGAGAAADYLADRSDTKFDQGAANRKMALDEELGRGTLQLNQAKAGEDTREFDVNTGLTKDKMGQDQGQFDATLGLNTRKQGFDEETGRAQTALDRDKFGLSQDQLREQQRQYDTDTGTKKEQTDYDRALRQKLASVRSKYVTGLAAGQTLQKQGIQ